MLSAFLEEADLARVMLIISFNYITLFNLSHGIEMATMNMFLLAACASFS